LLSRVGGRRRSQPALSLNNVEGLHSTSCWDAELSSYHNRLAARADFGVVLTGNPGRCREKSLGRRNPNLGLDRLLEFDRQRAGWIAGEPPDILIGYRDNELTLAF